MDIKSFIFLNLFCLLILYFNPFVEGDALYGLCANPECSNLISNGITIVKYHSPDNNKISVEPNEEVQIYVKDYGPKKDLWGVIVRGNKGYISKQFIRETRLIAKELVPAVFEFKTSNLVTDSYAVSSHLHVSSHPLQSDVISQTVQLTHASDYNLMSSASNNFHQQNNFGDLPSQQQNNFGDLASQQQNNFGDLASQQQNNFANLASQQQNFINSAPDNFQQQQDFMNSAPSSIQQEWNSLSENQVYNSPNSINPSSNLNLQPQLHQSSQSPIVPEQSSHFHMHSESILNSYQTTGMQSQDILPSTTHTPYIHSPNQHFSNDPVMASVYENSVGNVPSSFDSGNFNPDVSFTSQSYQSPHQPSPNEQLQNTQLLQAQGIHSPLYSKDYTDDDDYSKTLAMLSSRGFETSDMYANQEVHINPSSQNTERNFGFNAPEFNSISSQSQYPSSEISDTTLHSSIDSTLHLNENKIINSENPKTFSDNIISENINNVPPEKLNSVPHIEEEPDVKHINDDNSKEENEQSEMLSEENIENTDDEDFDDNNEEEDDDESDSSFVDELISSTKNIDSNENQLNVQSSGSSQINLQTSEGILVIQSSQKDSIHDSSTFNMPSKEHSIVIQSGQLEVTPKTIPSAINAVLQETKFSVNEPFVPESSMSESVTVRKTESVENFVQNNFNTISPLVNNIEVPQEKRVGVSNVFSEDLPDNLDRNNNEALTTESGVYKKEHTTPKISDFFVENEKRAEVEQILSPLDIDGLSEDLTTYQNRNLKGEYGTTDDPLSDSEGTNDENNTQSDSDSYNSYGNWFDALKAAMDSIISWIPEPLYSTLMDLQKKGISPRVPVFTTLCGFTCIFLIVPLIYLKDRSKESHLSTLLAAAEKNVYTLAAAKTVLEEKLETVQIEVKNLETSLAEEKSLSENLRTEFENQAEELENAKAELESCLEVIDALKEKENEYLTLINDHEKVKEYYTEHSENKVQELEKEKEQFLLVKSDYEDKLAQFDRNCNQLLQEAEVWNMRVKELTENIDSEVAIKEELMTSLKAKDEEIESLKELVETFKIFDEMEDLEEQTKSKEEKLQSLLNSVLITNQLKKEEEKSNLLDEQLQLEKNKILDMEVELLEAKSEIDKLKLNYNQALQDRTEAQTKLEVLTNYFKDKEIQLQRQLGAQEADRQKKEGDVNSAERRIMLMEQENASYKSQVASMKQEMEETERTLRSQIAAQEKKAHENWIAARAAERNLENMKQEVTQLRQRLTLLEREQENWANASRDEILRPVPKRMPGVNEESGSQETSERGMFPPPPLHDRLPLPPMMLPPDRPLPPIPPPPMPPMFLPPPPPHMERHFRPQPWHIPPDHNSDYRTTPPEFMGGRELTPPRGRPTIADGDTAPNTSSPMTTDTRDSRNSTPPHLLPDFHDIPPQPGRPYFPPPPGRPRFPMHPPYRRDAGPEPKRIDSQNESNLRAPPQPPASEQWQHSRV